MGATLEETARVRGALFTVELREEIARRKSMAVLAITAAVFFHAALLLLAALAAVAFWETHRVAALAVVTISYLGCGAAAFLRLRAEIASCPPPFASTLGELQQDLAQWHGKT
jgi:uncharacterized membrane protein YqjE